MTSDFVDRIDKMDVATQAFNPPTGECAPLVFLQVRIMLNRQTQYIMEEGFVLNK